MIDLFRREKPIDVTGPNDYSRIPYGFFRVRLANGKEVLGYRDAPITVQEKDAKGRVISERQIASVFGHAWPVRERFNLGGREIVLDCPRHKLPLVRLTFLNANSGAVARVGGSFLIDTERLRQPDEIGYDASDPAEGP